MNNEAIDGNRKTEDDYPACLACTRPWVRSLALHKPGVRYTQLVSGLVSGVSQCKSKQEGESSKLSLARQQFEALPGLHETLSPSHGHWWAHMGHMHRWWVQSSSLPISPTSHIPVIPRDTQIPRDAAARSSMPSKPLSGIELCWRLEVEEIFRGFLVHLLISKPKLWRLSPFPQIIRGEEKDSVFQCPS